MVLRVVLLLILIIISCEDSTIQPEDEGSIEGIVLDQVTNETITGAVITTSPPTNAIVTENDGSFIISDIPVSTYSISASKLNYKKNSVSVDVRRDKTAKATILLSPDVINMPIAPINPSPLNNAIDQPINLILTWNSQEIEGSDSVYYDIYLFRPNAAPELVSMNQTDTLVSLENLNYNTTYNWRVDAKDQSDNIAASEIWTFKTQNLPDYSITYAMLDNQNYNLFGIGLGEDSTPVQLTNSIYREWWPRFNPDKTKIAFSSDAQVENHIYIMNKDGSNSHKVTDQAVAGNFNYGIGFSWSANGDYILYTSYNKLLRMKSDGSELFTIAAAPEGLQFRECDWSPTNNKIVTLAMGNSFYESRIYLMNTDGSAMELLVDDLPGAVENPSFSPDGKKIIFTHDVSGHEAVNGRQLNSQIVIFATDFSDTMYVSQNKPAGTNDSNPRWSPDGAQIVFCNAPNYDDSKKSVWTMNVDGTDRKKIIESGQMPDWR